MRKRSGKKSVALRYDEALPAPIVIAKGNGRAAERIDEIATRAGVPLVRDDVAAAALEPRITSYNVCYTKLLRMKLRCDSITPFGSPVVPLV